MSRASSTSSRTPLPNPPVDDALLERHDEPLAARRIEDQLAVERLGEPRVDDADRPAVGRQRVGGLDGPHDDRPEPDEQEVPALAEDLAAADRQHPGRRPAAGRSRRRAGSAGRTGGPGSNAVRTSERQLLLVPRRGDDEIRELSLRGQREHALVARAVLADEPRAVDREDDRQVVLAHVVDGLVERTLEERRVQGDDRTQPAEREPGRERHRMLLGDPHVEEPVRELRLEPRQAGPGRHPRRDPDDPSIGPRELDQLRREDRGVVRQLLRGLEPAGVGGAASSDIDSVGSAGVIGGRAAPWNPTWSVSAGRIATALLRPDVDDRRAGQRQRPPERLEQRVEVVARGRPRCR